MKRNAFILALTLFALPLASQAQTFKFSYAGGRLLITKEAPSWKDAYKEAAHECLNHFTGGKGRDKVKVSRAVAEDVIDVCANPRRG